MVANLRDPLFSPTSVGSKPFIINCTSIGGTTMRYTWEWILLSLKAGQQPIIQFKDNPRKMRIVKGFVYTKQGTIELRCATIDGRRDLLKYEDLCNLEYEVRLTN
jgi:hypothetical protein